MHHICGAELGGCVSCSLHTGCTREPLHFVRRVGLVAERDRPGVVALAVATRHLVEKPRSIRRTDCLWVVRPQRHCCVVVTKRPLWRDTHGVNHVRVGQPLAKATVARSKPCGEQVKCAIVTLQDVAAPGLKRGVAIQLLIELRCWQ
eukprot:SAG11_NODE_1581_length_4648_cov_3.265993_1_plen_147_part_00